MRKSGENEMALLLSLLQKPLNVIPAKAGIQSVRAFLDPRFREGDGILEFCKSLYYNEVLAGTVISSGGRNLRANAQSLKIPRFPRNDTMQRSLISHCSIGRTIRKAGQLVFSE
jgi:hypothetical protein